MSLSERSRAITYRSLHRVFDDEETTAAVVRTLALDTDQLATKDFVRAEVQAAKTSMVLWYVAISTTQLDIILGCMVALR
jgi:hypothetical protein